MVSWRRCKFGEEATTGADISKYSRRINRCSCRFLAPTIYLRRQQGKRLIKFDNQLADMLSLMVNGLRAGYSIMQALEAVSKELPPPISDEFRRVVQEMQLGIPMDVALENLTRRIPSKDLDLLVTAINCTTRSWR